MNRNSILSATAEQVLLNKLFHLERAKLAGYLEIDCGLFSEIFLSTVRAAKVSDTDTGALVLHRGTVVVV